MNEAYGVRRVKLKYDRLPLRALEPVSDATLNRKSLAP